jgi:hypothetical protein
MFSTCCHTPVGQQFILILVPHVTGFSAKSTVHILKLPGGTPTEGLVLSRFFPTRIPGIKVRLSSGGNLFSSENGHQLPRLDS